MRRLLRRFEDRQAWMVESQIAARGVRDPRVLEAMREVPRREFVPAHLAASAHEDRALPIEQGQTISQPFIVALMAEVAEIGSNDKVLEVGTGSGYAAAVLSRLAAHVYTVERHEPLLRDAQARFDRLGYHNITAAVRDGSLGWPEHSPYNAIVVAAGAPPQALEPLKKQLAPGGRLVIPRGETLGGQELVRVRRSDGGETFIEEDLGAVAFVPLIGAAAWQDDSDAENESDMVRASQKTKALTIPERIGRSAEPFDTIESAQLRPLLERVGDATLVLLGEASHGTSDFYRMRARITQELIEQEGFDFVAVEADWPDATEIDAYVRHHAGERPHRKPFQRFPRWMWANTDVMEFVHWLREHNRHLAPGDMVGFHGMDLYSMQTSIDAVLAYLDDVDPDTGRIARQRYACLMPWQDDPILYGRATLDEGFAECEKDVLAILDDLLRKRLEYVRNDGARFFDAIQNARLVANAEKYYRTMYRGSVSSWNLRDQHMFDTLLLLRAQYGPESKGIVWAHNSHLGDAAATAMGARGEHNVGQLVRDRFGDDARLIGFGTHAGTVAAASDWGEPMQIMPVQPSHSRSYERLAHDSRVPRFMLHLRTPPDPALRQQLIDPRLERAIGVIYRPDTELQSHYFSACLPRQFDEWIWFDESHAVTPIEMKHIEAMEGVPETFPFGV